MADSLEPLVVSHESEWDVHERIRGHRNDKMPEGERRVPSLRDDGSFPAARHVPAGFADEGGGIHTRTGHDNIFSVSDAPHTVTCQSTCQPACAPSGPIGIAWTR